MTDEPTEQWDDSAADNWTPPELRPLKPGVSGGARFVEAPRPVRDFVQNEMTGMLAPTPEQFTPELSICWPDIPAERKAAILADGRFVIYLKGLPPQEQYRQILAWRDPAKIAAREKYEAEEKARREKRDAEIAAMPNHEQLCRVVRSLEATIIEQNVRIAALEEALANSKPAKVSRGTFGPTTTPPKDAA